MANEDRDGLNEEDSQARQGWISTGVKRIVDCEPLFILLMTCVGFLPVVTGLAVIEIQKARDAANRSQCKNGLKQLSLAIHNYFDALPTISPDLMPDDVRDQQVIQPSTTP